MRLRPEYNHHVWSYDFVAEHTYDGRKLRLLTIIDEYSRECLAVEVQRRLRSDDVLHKLVELFTIHGPPESIRSDNGPEFTTRAVRDWLQRMGVRTPFIEPGSPWEKGYNESFIGKLRDKLLDREIFCTLKETQTLVEWWRGEYNHIRLHRVLGYRPPAPQTWVLDTIPQRVNLAQGLT